MNMKLGAIATLAILTLTLASCTSSDGLGTLYVGGTNGLILGFEEGAPPAEVYDNGQSNMEILMRIENDGEFDTRDVRIDFTGISSNDFDGFSDLNAQDAPESYVGKAIIGEEVVEGSQNYLRFGELSFPRSLSGGGSLPYTLNADVCYGYATVATAQVCFESDYYDGSDACDPSVSELQVSGAPVQVRNLVTNSVGSSTLRLTFDVVRAGNVDIWAPIDGQACDPADRSEQVAQSDWVYVRVDDGFSGNLISCTNLLDREWDMSQVLGYPQEYRDSLEQLVAADDSGYVRIADGSTSVTCRIEVPDGTNGKSNVGIALAYFVEDRISHEFTVLHVD